MNFYSFFQNQKRQVSLGKRSYIPCQASKIVIASTDSVIFFNENELSVCMRKEGVSLQTVGGTMDTAGSGCTISSDTNNILLGHGATNSGMNSGTNVTTHSNQESSSMLTSNASVQSLTEDVPQRRMHNKSISITSLDSESKLGDWKEYDGQVDIHSSNDIRDPSHSPHVPIQSSLRRKRSKASRIRFSDTSSSDYIILNFKCHGSISCVDLFKNYIVVVLMEGVMIFLRIQDGELKRQFQCTVPTNVYCIECIDDTDQIVLLSNDRKLYLYGCSDPKLDSIPSSPLSPLSQSSQLYSTYYASRESLDSTPSKRFSSSNEVNLLESHSASIVSIHNASPEHNPSSNAQNTLLESHFEGRHENSDINMRRISSNLFVETNDRKSAGELDNNELDITAMHCEATWHVNRHMYSISRVRTLEANSNVASNHASVVAIHDSSIDGMNQDRQSIHEEKKEIVLLIGFVSGEFGELRLNAKAPKSLNHVETIIQPEINTKKSSPHPRVEDVLSPVRSNSSLKKAQSHDSSLSELPSENIIFNEMRIFRSLIEGNDGIQMPLYVCGDLKWKEHPDELNSSDIILAVFASLDGHIMVDNPAHTGSYKYQVSPQSSFESSKNNEATVQWHVSLETEIVGVLPVDLNGDGYHEIMVVTWDGMTYFIDQYQNMVTFNLKQRVRSFAVGKFRPYGESSNEEPQLCIFYLTFSDKIIICAKVNMKSIPMQTFDTNIDLSLQGLMKEVCMNDLEELNECDYPRIIENLLYECPSESMLDSFSSFLKSNIQRMEEKISCAKSSE